MSAVAFTRWTGRTVPSDWAALHLVKFLCVAGMVVVHGLYFTSAHGGRFHFPPDSWPAQLARYMMVLGFLPLLLPFTAGCVYRFRFRDGRRGALATRPSAAVLGEAALLAGLGFLMNRLAFGPSYTWAWNVLQFVAVGFVVIHLLLRLGGRTALAAGCLAAVAANQGLQGWFAAHQRSTWVRILAGDPTDVHAWAILPWLPAVLAGFLYADGYLLSTRGRRWILGSTLAGGVLVLASIRGSDFLPPFDPQSLAGPDVMVPSAVRLAGLLGVGALLFAAAELAAPRLRLRARGIVRCFSHGILWIYLIHMIVGTHLAWTLYRNFDVKPFLLQASPGLASVFVCSMPLVLLLVSWVVGWLSVVLLAEKRFHVRLRRVGARHGVPKHGVPRFR